MLWNRNSWFRLITCNHSEKIHSYNTESLHEFPEETMNELIVAEHGIAHEEHVRLPSNKDKQTTEKSSYNDIKASFLRSRALSFQWYTALDYSRRKDEINTKSFILTHQKTYSKPSLCESQ